jgi:hypothetical protein
VTDLSRITLWRINNGYEENANNQAATIFNQQSAREKTCFYSKEGEEY